MKINEKQAHTLNTLLNACMLGDTEIVKAVIRQHGEDIAPLTHFSATLYHTLPEKLGSKQDDTEMYTVKVFGSDHNDNYCLYVPTCNCKDCTDYLIAEMEKKANEHI